VNRCGRSNLVSLVTLSCQDAKVVLGVATIRMEGGAEHINLCKYVPYSSKGALPQATLIVCHSILNMKKINVTLQEITSNLLRCNVALRDQLRIIKMFCQAMAFNYSNYYKKESD